MGSTVSSDVCNRVKGSELRDNARLAKHDSLCEAQRADIDERSTPFTPAYSRPSWEDELHRDVNEINKLQQM